MRPWLAFVALLVFVSPLCAQGRIDRAREEMADPPDPTPKPKNDAPKDRSSPSRSSCSDDDADNFFGTAFLTACVAPFWLPAVLLHDQDQHRGYFPGHPYAVEDDGFIHLFDRPRQSPDLGTFDPARYKWWSVSLAIENGNNFDDLNRTGVRLAIDTASRFGLTANWDVFRERLPCGCVEYAGLGDVNLVYRIAQTEWLSLTTGVGGRVWTDRCGTVGGFNFTYGADFFPVKPLVLSTRIDLGNLNDAFVTRLRATAGWQIGRWELYGGYDYLRIGSVPFQGPLLGVRLWY